MNSKVQGKGDCNREEKNVVKAGWNRWRKRREYCATRVVRPAMTNIHGELARHSRNENPKVVPGSDKEALRLSTSEGHSEVDMFTAQMVQSCATSG